RQTADILAERERQLNEIVRNSPAVLFRALPNPQQEHGWRFVFNSANVGDVVGFSAEELQIDTELWMRRIHPADRERIAEAARRASLEASSGGSVVYDYRFRHRDGRTIWLQDTLRVLLDPAGRPQEMYGQSLDITDRRQAELALAENRRQLDEVVRNSPALLYRAVPDVDDPDGWRILYNSANAVSVIGFTADELDRNPPLWISRIHPEDRLKIRALTRRPTLVAAARQAPVTLEYRFRHKDGTEIWLQDSVRIVFDDDGNPIELYGQAMDVSERKAIDAQLAETRRIQDESVRNSPAILFWARLDASRQEGWVFLYHSANALDVLGYSVEELHADPALWVSRIDPNDAERTLAAANSLASLSPTTVMPVTYDYRFRRKDGHQIWLQDSVRILFDDKGAPTELYGQSLDITARKQAEQALEESRRQLDDIVRNSPAALFRAVPNPAAADGLDWVYYSDNIVDIIGLTAQSLYDGAADWLERIHPEDVTGVLATTRRFVFDPSLADAPLVQTYRFRHGDGREIWLQDTLRAIRNADGSVREIVGQNLDVTARKRMEIALAEANERVRQVLANSPILSYSAAPASPDADRMIYTFMSERSREILGMEPEDVIAISPDWLEHVHPADHPGIFATLANMADRAEYSVEYRFRRPDGSYVWLHDFGRPQRGPDGRLSRLYGHLEDVSAQHEAADALQKAEARLQHIVSNSPMATYTLQLHTEPRRDLFCSFLTENVVALVGYTAEELLETPSLWGSRIHPGDRDRIWSAQDVPAVLRQPVVEYRFTRKDGREVWLEDTSQAILGPDGQLVEIIGQIQDVTARKGAQLQLEESQRFISQLAEAIPSQAFVADVATKRVIYANRVQADLLNYDAAAAQGIAITDLLRQITHPEDREIFAEALGGMKTLADDDAISRMIRLRDIHDRWRDVLFRYRVFKRDALGQPAQILVVWDDLTEARQAERALADSQRMLSRMSQALPSVVYILDLTAQDGVGALLYANRYPADMLGYTDLDLAQKSDVRFLEAHMHPDDIAGWRERSVQISDCKDGEVLEYEFRLRAGDGGWHWIRARALVFNRDSAGRVSQVIGVMDDITQGRQAQEDLAASQRLLNRIAQAVPNVLYVLDFQQSGGNGDLIYSNRSLAESLGHMAGDIEEQGWLNFVFNHLHPDDWETYKGMVKRLFDLADGAVLETEYRLSDAQGAWHWLRARDLIFERNSVGVVTQVIGQVEDITVSKTLQNEVRAERDFAQVVLNALGQGVAVFNSAGLCEYVNPAGSRILGISAEAMQGVRLDALATSEQHGQIQQLMLAPAETWMAHTLEFRHRRPDGQIADLLVTVTPRLRDEQMIGAVVVFT
ncbi:MAG TPA: PAS domain-containing protein, partial [Anaerolineales bacterium]|nr:PAS domain-containing protein [Anaerolineales bacterium]